MLIPEVLILYFLFNITILLSKEKKSLRRAKWKYPDWLHWNNVLPSPSLHFPFYYYLAATKICLSGTSL